MRRASQNPASTGWKALTSCAMSMKRRCGACPSITPFMMPTKGSRAPKSVVSVMMPLARKTAMRTPRSVHFATMSRTPETVNRIQPQVSIGTFALLCACFVRERRRGADLSDGVDPAVRHRVRHFRTRGRDGARRLHGRARARRAARGKIPSARHAARAHLRAARARHRRQCRLRGSACCCSRPISRLQAMFGGQPSPPDSDHAGTTLFYLLSAFVALALPTTLMGATLAHAGALRRRRRSADRTAHRHRCTP